MSASSLLRMRHSLNDPTKPSGLSHNAVNAKGSAQELVHCKYVHGCKKLKVTSHKSTRNASIDTSASRHQPNLSIACSRSDSCTTSKPSADRHWHGGASLTSLRQHRNNHSVGQTSFSFLSVQNWQTYNRPNGLTHFNSSELCSQCEARTDTGKLTVALINIIVLYQKDERKRIPTRTVSPIVTHDVCQVSYYSCGSDSSCVHFPRKDHNTSGHYPCDTSIKRLQVTI